MGQLGAGNALATAILLVFVQGMQSLELLELRVPKHIVQRHPARLECNYNLQGEALYSIKWYKDGNEFYRYMPVDSPPGRVFNYTGVVVDLAKSNDHAVVLPLADLEYSGRYRCEVSAEGPAFTTVSDSSVMTVVALPDDGPHIVGARRRYRVDEDVDVTCSLNRSKPAAHLSWFVNSEAADKKYLSGPYYSTSGLDDLETATLRLRFKVEPRHFQHGDMKLKCLATILTEYWKSNEESIEGDKQRPPALESKGNISGRSRADMVQGGGGASTLCPWAAALVLSSALWTAAPGLAATLLNALAR